MRYLPPILAGLFAIFMGQSLARTAYIHYTEFLPAQREREAATARGDHEAEWKAFQKEFKAHDRSFDPLWFLGE
jgi:hypothetical protein